MHPFPLQRMTDTEIKDLQEINTLNSNYRECYSNTFRPVAYATN